jgi:hypothetical protein
MSVKLKMVIMLKDNKKIMLWGNILSEHLLEKQGIKI